MLCTWQLFVCFSMWAGYRLASTMSTSWWSTVQFVLIFLDTFKQLQDAPRPKSILKVASEDANQLSSIDGINLLPVPHTNPTNLIFVLSQYPPKISDTHFQPPRDVFDLVMRPTLSSKSRARAFLWLIWICLQSEFSPEDAKKTPFGEGPPP